MKRFLAIMNAQKANEQDTLAQQMAGMLAKEKSDVYEGLRGKTRMKKRLNNKKTL